MRPILLLLLSCCPAVRADDGPVPVPAAPSVVVSASRLARRLDDTAARSVVGHDELVRQGDATLADALARLPGITVGNAAGGVPGQQEIRLRGLGEGYTQVMLDGVPAPAGFSLAGLAPDLVERVEIMRVATPELSNQAIAGAINIVLKKKREDSRRLDVGAADSGGQLSPKLGLQWSQRGGDFSWTLAATLSRQAAATPSLVAEGAADASGRVTLSRLSPQLETVRHDQLSLAPRLDWTPADGDTVSAQFYLSLDRIDNHHAATETALLGAHSDFPDSDARYAADSSTWRSDLAWRHALAGGASLETRLGLAESRRRAAFRFDGDAADDGADARILLGRHLVASGPSERGLTLAGTWRQSLGEAHALALGWDSGLKRRNEYRRELQLDGSGIVEASSDDSYRARMRTLALFAQDDWRIAPRWSASLGLRWESIDTRSAAADQAADADSRGSVLSPILQTLYKPTPQDGLRLALSRTYKAPALADLVPRRYAKDNDNGPTNPDTQGNPALRPELAWGLDGGWEHAVGRDGLVGVSGFIRRIRDVTVDRLVQDGATWTATPVNGGAAVLRGLELEAKCALAALWRDAPAVDLHGSVGRYWSAVAAIPGPDNRLGRQAPLGATLGGDYRSAGGAFSAGASLAFEAPGAQRQSAQLSGDAGPKRRLDVYAVWKSGADGRWRLSLLNLLGQDGSETQRYRDESGSQWRRVVTSSRATLRLAREGGF